ncbi:hypothetical protein [Burkholderia perseverans]|uniref:hypothetical protein n=1 Tax=Burkholderia perseverans TaxID=2615214 RepID=UPI001FED929F|nr:hypothetical protein [Burkholderia perseverans]
MYASKSTIDLRLKLIESFVMPNERYAVLVDALSERWRSRAVLWFVLHRSPEIKKAAQWAAAR